MSVVCSCRTSTLRLFVRSIAQVQVPEDKFTRTAWQARRILEGRTSIWPPANLQCRQLHSTSAARVPQHDKLVVPIAPSEDVYGRRRRPKVEEAVKGSAPKSRPTQRYTAEELKYEESRANKTLPHQAYPIRANDGTDHQKLRDIPYKPGRPRFDDPPREKEDWQIQKEALKKKFPDGWKPRKRLSPDALVGIRALHQQFPDQYTTEVLADKFELSPEAIRRILRSKWQPSPEEEEDRQERWFKRGMSVWTHWAELGKKPPRMWRDQGIEQRPWDEIRRRRNEQIDAELEESEDAETAARIKAQKRLSQNLL